VKFARRFPAFFILHASWWRIGAFAACWWRVGAIAALSNEVLILPDWSGKARLHCCDLGFKIV
jgi:hypothetical protein